MIGRDPKHLGARVGGLMVLHTWSQTLEHHPHVHCVVPGGGLSKDGRRWVRCRRGFFLPVRVLSSAFRRRFLDGLARLRKDLRFGGATAALAQDAAFDAWIASLRKRPWVVYAKPPFGSPLCILKYLARYTHRVAISDRRILDVGDDTVTFAYRDRKRGIAPRAMTLKAEEFLWRFLLHVVPRGFVRIRHFGIFGNRCRSANLDRCRKLLGTAELTDTPAPGGDDVLDEDVVGGKNTATHPHCRACGSLRLLLVPVATGTPVAPEGRDTS